LRDLLISFIVQDTKVYQNNVGRLEELEASRSTLLSQLDAVTAREEKLHEEARNLERTMALLQHEVKEATRKAEIELEAKKNMENSLQDLKRKYEEEQNKRSRETTSNQITHDKISLLEKQVSLDFQLLLNHVHCALVHFYKLYDKFLSLIPSSWPK